MSYKVISTFSGCGGSSRGYKMAGLKIVASVEFVDFQAETYRLNFPNTKLYQADIRQLDPLEILKDNNLKVKELDILDGSPPCASFSAAGSREKGWNKVKKYSNTKQRTDDLFDEYIRFVKVIQPKIFIAENVAGLAMGVSATYLKYVVKELTNAGYKVKAKILNSANYSIAQKRRRLIIVGVRNDINIEYQYPEKHRKTVTVKELFPYIKALRLGPRWRTSDRPASTIVQSDGKRTNTTAIFSSYLVKTDNEVRKYTIEEIKKLQAFPDEHKFIGTQAQQWESIGRSVPPLLMKAVAEQAIIVLDKYKELNNMKKT